VKFIQNAQRAITMGPVMVERDHNAENLDSSARLISPDIRPWLITPNRVVAVIGIFIATTLLILRLYTKIHITKKFGLDDGQYIYLLVMDF
jgi:hypothetical protein